MPDIRVFANASALTEAAAQYVIAAYKATTGPYFSLVLSGGSTPRPLYEALARSDAIDWSRVQIYWGDERSVPPDHPDSNYRMAKEALLDVVALAPANIHRIPAELDPQEAAQRYEQTLRHQFSGMPRFDLVLLGMGDDGHTASLFPETAALDETQRLVVANFVPKLDTWRISMSAPLLNRAARVAFLVAGEKKAVPLHQVLNGPRQTHHLPSQMIAPEHGELVWFVDQAAAAELDT
jgi:6-phosphogluconolactonase